MVMQNTMYAGVDTGGFPAQPNPDAIIREVDNELIEFMDIRTPLLELFGGINGGGSIPQMKYWWVNGNNWTRRPTHGGFADTVVTNFTLTANAHNYPIGTVFRLGTELVRVIAIVDADNVTVTRGYAGTTPAIHASSAECLVAGSTMSEADNWVYRARPTVSLPYNYMQIDHTALRDSWPAQQVKLYGVDGAAKLDKDTLDTMKQKIVGIEEGFVVGQRFVGDVNEPSMSGGILFFATSANGAQVTNKGGAALQEADIYSPIDAIARTYGAENAPDLFIMDRWAKTKFASFYAGSRRMTQDEKVGGSVINKLETEWGPIDLLMHYALPQGFIIGLKKENVKHHNLGNLGPHVGETMETQGPFTGRYYYQAGGYSVKNIPTFIVIHNYSLNS